MYVGPSCLATRRSEIIVVLVVKEHVLKCVFEPRGRYFLATMHQFVAYLIKLSLFLVFVYLDEVYDIALLAAALDEFGRYVCRKLRNEFMSYRSFKVYRYHENANEGEGKFLTFQLYRNWSLAFV